MDSSRYKELIKLMENNSISDDQFSEWIEYGALIESQAIYNRKQKYLLLIDRYCNRQIGSIEFRSLFSLIEKEESAIYDDIENFNFKLADDVLKFSDLITEISILCLDFDEPYETKEEMAKAEILFYSLVKKHYLKLQKLLSVSSKKNLDYDKLIFRSFNMLRSILGTEFLTMFLYILWGNT